MYRATEERDEAEKKLQKAQKAFKAGDIKQLESVQRRAARWVCGSHWNPACKQWSRSSDCCLDQLEWPLLHQRQNYFTICQVHKILHHQSAISSRYFSAVNRHSNPSAIDTSIPTINAYQFSFFINSPFLWNNVPYNILQITDPKLFCVALRCFLFKLNVALYLFAIVLFYLLLLYLCIVLVSCTVLSFGEHVCRLTLLCNPYHLTKIDNNNNNNKLLKIPVKGFFHSVWILKCFEQPQYREMKN